jgi:hypothetical protein
MVHCEICDFETRWLLEDCLFRSKTSEGLSNYFYLIQLIQITEFQLISGGFAKKYALKALLILS